MQIFRAVIPPLIHLEGGAVFKILKWLFIIALVLALAGAFWMAFGLWTGIYSLYSYPPSKAHPNGATLLITRDEKEPTFNSPDYNPPARQASSEGGMSSDGREVPVHRVGVQEIARKARAGKEVIFPPFETFFPLSAFF
jgi:hypothetical protein